VSLEALVLEPGLGPAHPGTTVFDDDAVEASHGCPLTLVESGQLESQRSRPLDPSGQIGTCRGQCRWRHHPTTQVGLDILATQPSELHALTADLSARETDALLQRLLDVHGERAKSPQQLHAEVRAVWQREHELLDELTALLDDAQSALCEALPPLRGADAGGGDGDDPPSTEAPR